jgi:hypothetical protein
MLAVLPRFTESNVEKAITKVASRVMHRNETILRTWSIWMPYHRLCVRCDDTDTSTPRMAMTVLNAVFCGIATERELMQLFRPKHLEKPLENTDPEVNEIACAYAAVDLDQIVGTLIRGRAQVQVELAETKQQLSKDHRNMQWRYLLLPTSTRCLEREKQTSSKFAELQSTLLSIDICLNLARGLVPQRVEAHDIVYIPMAVVQLKQEDGLTRYLLIDLTTGKEDSALTKLCETVDNFKSELERASQCSP